MVLEMLDFSTLDVARWYSLAVRLADVIASDELSLKLHDILKRFNCLVLTVFSIFTYYSLRCCQYVYIEVI